MKRRAAVALALLCPAAGVGLAATIPAHPRDLPRELPAPPLPRVEGRRVELAGGTVVYLAEDHSLPLVEIAAALRVGSFLDPPGEPGLASLAGALLRLGGAGGLAATAFDDRADELGARIESRTATTRGGASLSAPSWAFEPALELFLQMLASPRFESARLDTTRAALLEAMARRNEDPLQILEREWEWLLFGPAQSFTAPLTPAGLERFDRERVAAFHRRFWRPERLILAVSGDFDRERLLARLEAGLGAWSAPPAGEAGAVPWPPPVAPFTPRPGLYHVESPSPQAKVALGHPTPHLDWNDPRRFALEVMGEILGGSGAISRLAGRLRTAEGLVYRAAATWQAGDILPGQFQVSFDASGGNVARAVTLAREEIERLRRRPVAAAELEAAKTGLLSSLRLAFDTAEEIAGRYAEDELLGRPHEWWESYRRGVAAVGPQEVLRAAAEHLRPDSLVVLVVGRWEEVGGGAPGGASPLERAVGRPVVHLPLRDPLTLEPLPRRLPPDGEGR